MANKSIKRAAEILNLFSYAKPVWRGGDLARAVGLPATTVHGILQALEEEGFLVQDKEAKTFSLGQGINILGEIQRATNELNQKAEGPINYLSRHTGLECRVGVFYRDVVVLTANTSRLTNTMGFAYVGPVSPAYCTAMGRAILAHLPREKVAAHLDRVKMVAYTPKTLLDRKAILKELEVTRERGYSLSLQEMIIHMESVGAPVYGPGPEPVGAVAQVGTPTQISGGDLSSLAQGIMSTAAEISSYMGHRNLPQFR